MSKKLLEQSSLGKRIAGITMPIERKRIKWGRNWLCMCDSGKKYKHCCMNEISNITKHDGNARVRELSEDVQKLVDDIKQKEGVTKNE